MGLEPLDDQRRYDLHKILEDGNGGRVGNNHSQQAPSHGARSCRLPARNHPGTKRRLHRNWQAEMTIEPRAWIADVLHRISVVPHYIDELLPGNWKRVAGGAQAGGLKMPVSLVRLKFTLGHVEPTVNARIVVPFRHRAPSPSRGAADGDGLDQQPPSTNSASATSALVWLIRTGRRSSDAKRARSSTYRGPNSHRPHM